MLRPVGEMHRRLTMELPPPQMTRPMMPVEMFFRIAWDGLKAYRDEVNARNLVPLFPRWPFYKHLEDRDRAAFQMVVTRFGWQRGYKNEHIHELWRNEFARNAGWRPGPLDHHARTAPCFEPLVKLDHDVLLHSHILRHLVMSMSQPVSDEELQQEIQVALKRRSLPPMKLRTERARLSHDTAA